MTDRHDNLNDRAPSELRLGLFLSVSEVLLAEWKARLLAHLLAGEDREAEALGHAVRALRDVINQAFADVRDEPCWRGLVEAAIDDMVREARSSIGR